VTAAQLALAAADDPNRPVSVRLATALPMQITLALRIHPDRTPSPLIAAVRRALVDADAGLLGTGTVVIGRPLFVSQIDAACCDMPGLLAVRGLQIEVDRGSGFAPETGFRVDPGEGCFFQLDPSNLFVRVEA
jgi:hypothetical protein